MKILIGLICSTAILAATANAGVYVESVNRDRATGKLTADNAISIEDGKARIDAAGKGSITLFKDDSIYQIDPSTKSYRVLDKATMNQLSTKMNDAMARMKAQMAQMPSERRAMMEQMMSKMGNVGATGAKKTAYDATDTGKSESSGGRSCRVWDVTRDGVPDQQYCVAPASSLPGSDEFLAFAQKMGAFFETLQGPARALGAGFLQQQIAVMSKVNGFPIIRRDYTNGQLGARESVVKTWERRVIPASQFDVPAGYTRRDIAKDLAQ